MSTEQQTTINLKVGGLETGDVPLSAVAEALAEVRGGPKMKDDPDWQGHNLKAYEVTAAELRQFVERVEQLESEKREIAEQIKEVYSESKGRGYDTKALKTIISLRKKNKDDLAEEEAVLEVYKEALGMR